MSVFGECSSHTRTHTPFYRRAVRLYGSGADPLAELIGLLETGEDLFSAFRRVAASGREWTFDEYMPPLPTEECICGASGISPKARAEHAGTSSAHVAASEATN